MLPVSGRSGHAPKFKYWTGRPQRRWLFLVFGLAVFVTFGLWAQRSPATDNAYLHPSPLRMQIPIPSQPTPKDSIWVARKYEVRNAYVHALSGYLQHAFPHDELRAMSGGASDKFNGWGVTMIDSMDTMWIMGLHAQFHDVVRVVAEQNFTIKRVNNDGYAPFFETNIRYLGGLLSAYALSKEPILLTRADDLGQILLPVFNTTPSGLPAYSVNPKTGKTGFGWMGGLVLFSEAASCQLEFKYLAKLTGRADYYEKVENVMNVLYRSSPQDGLFTTTWFANGAPRGLHFSVGASADSGYEYLLKQWLLTGDTKARKQYLESINGIVNNLFFVSPRRELLYVTDTRVKKPTHNLEHLSCFLPGVLALGVHTLNLPPDVREIHEWAANGLAHTCWLTYADQASGLGPDVVTMEPGQKWMDLVERWKVGGRKGGIPPGLREGERKGPGERDYRNSHNSYLLRPETIESFFILWKVTGDVKWRERGYAIFNAINEHAKTHYGYASVAGVDDAIASRIDDMPSYFLAETLKYLYLLFDEEDSFPLDKWVFNTEAHPLPVFDWSTPEKELYGIS